MSSRCLAEEEAAESADVEGIATKQGGKSVKYGYWEKEWCLRNPICQVLRPLYLTTPLSLIVQLERRWSLPHDFVEQNILFQVAACKRMYRDMGVS